MNQLADTLKAVAEDARRFADITARSIGHEPTPEELNEKRTAILKVASRIADLAEAAKGRAECEILVAELGKLGMYETQEQLLTVSDALKKEDLR